MEHSPYKRLKVNYSLEGRGLSACPGEGKLGKLCLVIVGGNLTADLPKFENILSFQGPRSCSNENNGAKVPNDLPQNITWLTNQDIR